MFNYVLRRVILAIPVLWGAATVVFFAIRLIPGDVVLSRMEGQFSSEAQIQAAREELGLDVPSYVQYFRWLGGIATGDFGNSLSNNRPVLSNIFSTISVSFELAILALVIGILIALPLGILAATYQNTWIDYLARVMSIAGLSVPSFVLATSIILLPALWWGYYPPLGYVSIFQDPIKNLQIMLPAALALGAILAGSTVRMTRAMVLEIMRQDYIRTAQAKGLRDRAIMMRHVLKNALIPVMTLWGTQFANLLGGTIVIELIFSLPGVGRMTLQAIEQRDYTQLQMNVIFFAFVFVTFNLIVDLLYGVLDPRIRYS
jgi:peptide/nickel transport system permease protein